MFITDTHTHLYVEQFDEDREAVIKKAMDAGVKRFFLPAIDSAYTGAMLELQQAFPEVIYLMTGLHPTHVKENYEQELQHVADNLDSHTYHAVGEIGIDLYWDDTYIKEQEEAFRRQIRLAASHDLPIVIHCRESFDEIVRVLKEERTERLRGIFHCFTGNLQQAREAIGLNMKLGIGGVVTFKNGGLDTFLEQVDLRHIVVETDSPYLAPVPYRGKRNESSYILHVVDKLAEIYGLTREKVAEITTENAIQIFGL